MAVRQIRIMGDEILIKKCRPVKAMNDCTMGLTRDMFETMYQTSGRGLATLQVGVLKRIATTDVGGGNRYVLINPEITATNSSRTGCEGCLSPPGKLGIVTRPNYVEMKTLNRNTEPYGLEGEGLLAKATCHECTYLEGQMYVELVEGELVDAAIDEEEIVE